MQTQTERWPVAPVAVMFAVAAITWPSLPDELPTRWSDGEPSSYSSKNVALFFFPAVTLALYVVLRVLARRYGHDDGGQRPLWWVRVIIPSALLVAYLGMQASYWGYGLHAGAMLGGVLLGLGLLPPLERNPLLGVRTPWTLRSDRVWIRTNRLGARLLTGIGACAIVADVVGLPHVVPGTVVTALAVVGMLNIYSYVEWRREREG